MPSWSSSTSNWVANSSISSSRRAQAALVIWTWGVNQSVTRGGRTLGHNLEDLVPVPNLKGPADLSYR